MATDTPPETWNQQLGARFSSSLSDLMSGAAAVPTTTDSLLLAELAASSSLNPASANASQALVSEEEELKLLMFPSKREDLSTAIPLTVIFALLLVTGCIGNLCTAIVIARPKNKYMHTATNYYLFSLAMSDFLFLTLGLPQEMFALWQRYPYAFGEFFCIIRGYLSEASTYASILTISAFTIERYVAICHPLWAHTMSQLPRAITSIVIIWILAAICAIPPAAGLGIITQKGPLSNRTLEQSAQCATKRVIYENMFVVSAIVFFIVPMIIVTVLYILIAIELRRSSKMNSAISKQSSGTQSHQAQSANTCCQQRHRLNHAQSQQLITCRSPTTDKQQNQSSNRTTDSLTIDLMSERPASALGTERGGGFLSASLAKLSPFGLSMRTLISKNQQQQQRQMCSCCCRRAAMAALQKSQSNQLAGNLDVAIASHSPLSYHESLIQHHKQHKQHHLRQDVEQQGKLPVQQMCPPNNGGIHHHCQQSSSMRNLSTKQTSAANRPGQLNKPRGLMQHTNNNQHHLHNQHHVGSHHHHHRRSTGASSKKSVVRMLVAVVVSFFICWVPFHAQRLLASYLSKDENQNPLLLDIYLKLTYISGVMYYLSSTINPLLYQLMSAKFRLAFKETFKCSLFKCLQRHSQCSPSNSLKDNHTSHNQPRLSPHFHHYQTNLHGPQISQQSGCVSAAHCSSSVECCSLAAANPAHHQPPNHYNQLTGRLRNLRLGASFASLLRPNNVASGSNHASPVECCGQCRAAAADEPACASPTTLDRQPAATNQLLVPASRAESSSRETITSGANQGQLGGGNFAPRTTLKFVAKSPTPTLQRESLSRICSRGDDEEPDEETTVVQVEPGAQAKCAAMEALIKPIGDLGMSAAHSSNSNLTNSGATTSPSAGIDSSPSPQSSTSSQGQHRAVHQKVALNESSTSNESRSGRPAPPLSSQTRLRRRSLQQHQQPSPDPSGQQGRGAPASAKEEERRKSSTSSAAAKQHFSSSLSSSERQLDKKLSLSTTTSAIYDCGSYTTTHSQLTGCGSNGSNPALIRRSSEEEEDGEGIEEEEPTTVLNVCDTTQASRITNEEAEETDSLLQHAASPPQLNKKRNAGKPPQTQPACR